tara:strand:- start:1231 stop:1548 length:318 start_codon:yes stop_codon:yes gene_type:complete
MTESKLVDKLNQQTKETKIEEADLTKIKDLRDKYKTQTIRIGQLNVERILMNQAVDRLNNAIQDEEKAYVATQEEERVLVKELQDKYGVGQLNIDTGTFSSVNTK